MFNITCLLTCLIGFGLQIFSNLKPNRLITKHIQQMIISKIVTYRGLASNLLKIIYIIRFRMEKLLNYSIIIFAVKLYYYTIKLCGLMTNLGFWIHTYIYVCVCARACIYV